MKSGKIGFIGIGVMGNKIVQNFLSDGFKVYIYTRTKSKAENLIDNGAIWCDSIAEVTAHTKIIITMLGTPEDVENVYFNSYGILQRAQKGSYVIDMTTSSPKLAERIYKGASEKGVHALDAPVSGGEIGAEKRTLTIMVGGEVAAYQEILFVLESVGKSVVLQGKAGAGQSTKIANQIMVALTMIGISEAIVYLNKAGLNMKRVTSSIKDGSAHSWLLEYYVPKILNNDYSPGGTINNFITDLEIVTETVERLGLSTPGIKLAYEIYKQLDESGLGKYGIQSLVKWYE